jgi:hypothetical protein
MPHEGIISESGGIPEILLERVRSREPAPIVRADAVAHRAVHTDLEGYGYHAARGVTFKEGARRYIAGHEAAWRKNKHRAQWRATLET